MSTAFFREKLTADRRRSVSHRSRKSRRANFGQFIGDPERLKHESVALETMGLEPTTPCLQSRFVQNGGDRLRPATNCDLALGVAVT